MKNTMFVDSKKALLNSAYHFKNGGIGDME